MAQKTSLDLCHFFSMLVEAIAKGHTPVSLSRRIAEVLWHHFPLKRVELGWYKPEQCSVFVVEKESSTIIVKEETRLSANTIARQAITKQKIYNKKPKKNASYIEEKEAYRLKISHLIIVPIAEEQGFLNLYLRKQAIDLDKPLLDLLIKILGFAQQNCRLIAKVAKLSRNAHETSQKLRQELEKYICPIPLVAESPTMKEVLKKAKEVAPLISTVVLRGESGVGKDVLARYIHYFSKRRQKPMVAINCGALPDNLLESELFGHEKGAFTGAYTRHIGCLERAHGGTLFLDEIAELSLSAQVKLLRFLEENTLQRVGGEKNVKVDVRILAATNRSLEQMIDHGQFRADLYYRINVFPLKIPSLCERKEDLPRLAKQLVSEICKKMEIKTPQISFPAIEQILNYHWPGNVRELSNVLERAVILNKGKKLLKLDIPIRSLTTANAKIATLEEATKSCIEKCLKMTRGKIYGEDGAAHYLGVKPSTLQSKMKKMGIKREMYFSEMHS